MNRILFLASLLILASYAKAQSKQDTISIRKCISDFYEGFQLKKPDLVRNAIDSRLLFFNDNYSNDPLQWQSHLYLADSGIDTWIKFMIHEASPHQNRLEWMRIYIRGKSALVVTNETGSNRFRSWKNQTVVWNLGFNDGKWLILSAFLRDISNP